MKRIVSVTNSAEAHLLVEALHQEGIAASVQGEWGSLEGPSVWIENDSDTDRANTLVAEMMAKQRPVPTTVQPGGRSSVFVGGLLLGLLLGAVIAGAFRTGLPKSPEATSPVSWDVSGDGKPDNWASYDLGGRLVASSADLNLDGTPDSWLTYNPPGVLSIVRYDEDFDGREDLWEVHQKGIRVSYTADNDRNGVVDEWGRFENATLVERNWSFSNDRVADKRAFYRAGRKVREESDRDRDGVFEQTVLFDEFEREVSRR
jgi:hypothetical protein